jgi:hypothetical protein
MARRSGAADPSGAGFDGSGNTDTMLAPWCLGSGVGPPGR